MYNSVYKHSKLSITIGSIVIALSFFILFVVYNSCSKDQYPRITKFKLTSNISCSSQKYLEIVDLSDAKHRQCGVQYSANKTFDQDSSENISDPKKIGYCININVPKCQSKIYLRPFCYEGNDIKYGEIDSTGGGGSYNLGTPTIDNIDTSKKPEIHITYSIPDDPLLLIDQVLLCYNLNSSNDVTINDHPKLITKKGKGLIDTFPVATYNAVYTYRLFITYCNKTASSLPKSFNITNPNSSICNAKFGDLSWQQKSPTKILITGSLTSPSNLKDWGFCEGINCSPKYSMKYKPASNFETILTASPPTIKSVQLYYECNSTIKGNTVSIEFKSPNLSKPVLSYSVGNLKMQSTFDIINYLSTDYGFCYSYTNANPTISDIIGSIGNLVMPTFEKSITVQSGRTYYVRSYVMDCDGIRYSNDAASYNIPSSNDPCILGIMKLTDFNGNDIKNAASFIINNELYIGGGISSNGNVPYLFLKYNNSKYLWERKADMFLNTDTRGIGAYFTIDNVAYIMQNKSSNLYQYDLSNNKWVQYSGLPSGNVRQDQASANSETKGYLLGGYNSTNGTKYMDLWEFDPQRPSGTQWTEMKNWNAQIGERIQANMVYLNNSIFIIGGNKQKDFWEYKIPIGTWTKIPNLPSELYDFNKGTFIVKNGLIYAANQNSNFLWVFDPNKGWSKCSTSISFLTNRQYGINAYNGNVVYLGLGSDMNVYKIQ